MTLEEIKKKLDSLNIPVAYRTFFSNVKPPYVVYYCDKEEYRGSDFENLIGEKEITIELYCSKKDLSLEKKIEELFNFTTIEKSEIYLNDEKLIMTIFEFEIIVKEK